MIQSKVVADSIDKRGNRITSCIITFPRIILAELNTHRMLSKNSASSRAIPFNKMVESVQNNPFIPIAWQIEHKGMQGNKYIDNEIHIRFKEKQWLNARDNSIESAKDINDNILFQENTVIDDTTVTKQLCNRLLEPFMYHTVLITGTDDGWNNFFDLRCPSYEYNFDNLFKSKKEYIEHHNSDSFTKLKVDDFSNLEWLQINKGQAEIHMMALAEAIYDSFNESIPKLLNDGEWHIPFDNQIDEEICKDILADNMKQRGEDYGALEFDKWIEYIDFKKVQISTSMAARTSYTVVGDEKEVSYEKLIELHNKLINQKPLHASPMEHCARVMTDEEYFSHIKSNGNVQLANVEENFDNDFPPLSENSYDLFLCNLSKEYLGWCRNYRGFIQYRHILENEKSNS